MRTLIHRSMGLSLAFLFLVSCSHSLGVTVRSTADLNNGGNPVVVRIYQLKSVASFQRATAETFWNQDKATLGSDLLGDPIEIVMHPNETRKIKGIDLNKETNFIGAAADFYKPDVQRWKSILDVTKMKGHQIVLAVGDDGLLLDSIK